MTAGQILQLRLAEWAGDVLCVVRWVRIALDHGDAREVRTRPAGGSSGRPGVGRRANLSPAAGCLRSLSEMTPSHPPICGPDSSRRGKDLASCLDPGQPNRTSED